jgi:predicted exporter
VGSLVAAIVRWAHRRRTVVVSIVAVGLIVSIEGTRRLSFDADVLSLLPRDSQVIQWAAGALAIAGVELDLFAVFAVVTFVGIGVDCGAADAQAQ